MDVISTLILGLIASGLAPVGVYLTHSWIEKGRKNRAFARLKSEPLYQVGAKIDRLIIEGNDTPIMVDCEIVSMDVGRVVIASGDERMSFTGREFERLHPVFRKSGL